MKVQSVFFANEKNRDKVLEDLTRGIDAFDRLSLVLQERIKERVPVSDYDSPSWAYKQADRNGYERAIREVLSLIKFKE